MSFPSEKASTENMPSPACHNKSASSQRVHRTMAISGLEYSSMLVLLIVFFTGQTNALHTCKIHQIRDPVAKTLRLPYGGSVNSRNTRVIREITMP